MNKALIVHSRRTGLGIIRALGKKGFEIIAADTFKAAGFYSRYVKDSYLVPDMISQGEEAFCDKLMEIGETHGNGERLGLFTGTDDYLITFAKNWDRLSRHYLPTFETDLDRLLNSLEKVKVYQVAEKAGVPYPQTLYSPVTTDDVKKYPVIIKPTVKKTDKVDVVKEAFRIRKCQNSEDLKDAISQLEKINIGYVVQQYIAGGDDTLYTAGVYSYQGNMVAAASCRKIRQFPPNLGECSLGELVNEPKVIEYSKRLMAESGLTGISQVEFKKQDDEFYLMEINPRPWSWNSLIEYAGLNLPAIAYEVARDPSKALKSHEQKRFKGKWMYLIRDYQYNVKKNKNISRMRFLADFFRSSKCAHWQLTDPIPFFADWYNHLTFK